MSTQDDEDRELQGLLHAADLEKELNPGDTAAQRAQRILDDAAAVAAMSIVDLSRRAANENLRYKASVYILDRVIGDVKGGSGSSPIWERVFQGIQVPDDASQLLGD